MSTAFANYSMHTGQRYERDWYDWCVFASGDEAELQHIKSIEYTLHPSFPDPVRTVSDRDHRFAVMSNGWGSFTMKIRTIFCDGPEEFTSHFVKLDSDHWPRKSAGAFANEREQSVYAVLMEGKYRWRSGEAIQKQTNISADTVIEILNRFEAQNLARKSPFRSIDKKELWGATAIVGIAPSLRWAPGDPT